MNSNLTKSTQAGWTVRAPHGKSASKSPRQPRAQAASIEQAPRPGRREAERLGIFQGDQASERPAPQLDPGLRPAFRSVAGRVAHRRAGWGTRPDLAQRAGGTHGPGQ